MNTQGITQKRIPKLSYPDLVRHFIEHKRASVREEKMIRDCFRTLIRFGEFLRSDVPIARITIETLEAYIAHRKNTSPEPSRSQRIPETRTNDDQQRNPHGS